jgi:Co/Zn/Cd efflux system component
MSKSDKNHNHSHQDQSKKNIKIAFFINFIFSRLSLVAIALNGYAAWILSKGTSKNEGMLNLHMLEDVLGWIGVLIVSILMNFTEAYRSGSNLIDFDSTLYPL